MRQALRILLASWMIGGASGALANGLGITFSAFAPGTQFHYSYDGVGGAGRFIDIYQGAQSGQHIVHRYDASRGKLGPLRRIIAYDAQGRMVSQERRALRTKTVWKPYHCENSGLARCEHVRITYDSRTGAEKSSIRKVFAYSLRGRTLHVVENATSNRLKFTRKLDKNNVLLLRRETVRFNGKNVRRFTKLDRIVKP